MDSIYIGFDGGGSRSRFLIGRGHGEPEIRSFPVNLKYSDLGINKSARGFAKCLRETLGEDLVKLAGMCISLSGASDAPLNKEFALALRRELALPHLKLHIESDSSFTLTSAFPDDHSGILLIAGTGSIAIAKKQNGEIVKVGGWGRLLGDEGSGYWIGLQALKSYCKHIDTGEKKGKLFAAIEKQLYSQITGDLSLLRSKLYNAEILPQNFAQLVFEHFTDDHHAEDIILHSAALLFETMDILHEKVYKECEPVLMLHGSIARQPVIFEYMKNQVGRYGVLCKILNKKAPLDKALKLAQELT
jgi:N-acetylglucosamine kinase-like BadF-type ATPase